MDIRNNLLFVLQALAWDHGLRRGKTNIAAFQRDGFAHINANAFRHILRGQQRIGNYAKPLEEAAISYVKRLGIDLDQVLQAYRPNNSPGENTIPEEMRGLWFAILFRTNRQDVDENDPTLDYRVGVLVFGDDEDETRHWQVIGQNSLWRGTLYKQDEHFRLTGNETESDAIQDSIEILVHRHHPYGDMIYNHGLALGVGRGAFDPRDFPIFASRCLLWKINSTEANAYKLPLDDERIGHLRQYCGYISETDLEQASGQEAEPDPVILQRNQAIETFKRLANVPANSGDGNRILIRW